VSSSHNFFSGDDTDIKRKKTPSDEEINRNLTLLGAALNMKDQDNRKDAVLD
jgi:hypothetical protein